jgi:hypothetical protein
MDKPFETTRRGAPCGEPEPNAFIKVRLTSGKSFADTWLAPMITSCASTRRRVAEPLRRLAYSDVVSIERQKEAKWNPTTKVLVGVGVAWAVLYGIALLAFASGYD